ncbi:MAG: apolipoprotein N-acyltransferase [Chloroherpetonaceae bacterium]|nr:apolipoprotein N-acyltransferase [Chthonomonadaceae bacterium]MDW8208581.1 apolipoprotein N-acyltransferase [Chloroherpetonaceae bacterium]
MTASSSTKTGTSIERPVATSPAASGVRLALLSGLLLYLAHPPVAFGPLAWVALVPLLLSVTRSHHGHQAAWHGYLFGWAFLGPTWYWTGLTIVGWTGSAIGWLAWFGLTLILAGFYALWGVCAWWIHRHTAGNARVLLLSAAWVTMEWARTFGSLSMPWAQLSYTQYRWPLILQMVDLTGAYGLSGLIFLVNASIAEWWVTRATGTSFRPVYRSFQMVAALTASALLYGLLCLNQPQQGRPLTVAALQGGFDNRTRPDFQRYFHLTHTAIQSAPWPWPGLHVWSESAAPGDAVHDIIVREIFSSLSTNYRAAILIGARVVAPDRSETNSAVLFMPGRKQPLRYDKVQLVPFGEFIPFRRWFPPAVAQMFSFFETDVKPGVRIIPLQVETPDHEPFWIGPFICYESMYPHYARRMTDSGAQLLVTISNDSWFRSVAAMEQHLAAVVLRAVENRRDVVRSTSTGITCFVDARGQVTARAPLERPAALVRTVLLRDDTSLYTRAGDWFPVFCALAIGVAVTHRPLSRRYPS